MLPLTLLPTSESGSFLDSLDTLNAPVSEGDSGSALDTAFATILGNTGPGLLSATPGLGEALPGTGKTLPLLQEAHQASTVAGPDEIAASLKEQIARLFPPSESVGPGSAVTTETADAVLVEQFADSTIDRTIVAPDTDHAGPVNERVPVDTLQAELTNHEPVDATIESTLLNPALSGVVAPSAPVTDRTAAAGSRQVPRAAGSVVSLPVADAPLVSEASPDAMSGEAELPTVDNRAADSRATAVTQGQALPTAALPTDPEIELQGQPRPALAEISGAAAAARTTAPPVTTLPAIEVGVQDPAWDRAVSERVVMMAANKIQTAEIRLTPAELGPLRIRVAVEDGAAQVSFVAQHAVTRDVLEQALPRLREMFTDTGLQLGDARVDVDTADTREQHAERNHSATPELHESGSTDIEHDTGTLGQIREQRGLVDTFV